MPPDSASIYASARPQLPRWCCWWCWVLLVVWCSDACALFVSRIRGATVCHYSILTHDRLFWRIEATAATTRSQRLAQHNTHIYKYSRLVYWAVNPQRRRVHFILHARTFLSLEFGRWWRRAILVFLCVLLCCAPFHVHLHLSSVLKNIVFCWRNGCE